MLGMTLIDLPLSEFVVVSEVVDNMSQMQWRQMCIVWTWKFRIIIAAVVCISGITVNT